MPAGRIFTLILGIFVLSCSCLPGCSHGPQITAVNLDPKSNEPEGVPYYLPKPYLFVSKNIRYIPTPTVGLTETVPIPSAFDSKAGTTPPAEQPKTPTPPPKDQPKTPTTPPTPTPPTPSPTPTPPATDSGTPKPYLFASKNIRYIPAPTVDLTKTVPIPSAFDSSGAQSPTNAGGNGKQKAGTAVAAAKINQPKTPTPPPKDQPKTPTTPPDTETGQSNKKPSTTPTGPGPTTNPTSVYGSQVFGPTSIAVIPPASISDGLIPQEFYTYQIVYLPDLTQKYGLRIKAGAGEFRATQNLVNGWMYTGLGPIYMGNSTTAQNVTAAGQAAGSLVQSLGQIVLNALGIPSLGGIAGGVQAKQTTGGVSRPIKDYAQLYIYEPELTDNKKVTWKLLEGFPKNFERDFIELERDAMAGAPATQPGPGEDTDLEQKARNDIQKALEAIDSKYKGLQMSVNISTELGTMRVNAPPLPGMDTSKLKQDVMDCARAFANENKIKPEHVTVTTEKPAQ